MKEKVIQELKYWLFYFAIALAASTLAYQKVVFRDVENEDINYLGVVRKMLHVFLFPWVKIFLVLSRLRLLIVFIIQCRNVKSVMQK